MNAGIEQ